MRVEVPLGLVEFLTWHRLPPHARIYIYVPYAPSVVDKYGADPATGLPCCSGPTSPDGLLPSEAPGLGLQPPSLHFPIVQTYIDVCITGCLEHGERSETQRCASCASFVGAYLGCAGNSRDVS